MGNPDSVLSVRIVFLLALVDPRDQVKWLQRFMRGLRDQSFLSRLTEAASPQEAVDIVRLMLELDPAREHRLADEARPGR
jgi:mannitol/fructose-specific phosphotransferase system IIA component (Ntr-type)